jgi:predicted NUDIX family NTP pyrophosphohydrolase
VEQGAAEREVLIGHMGGPFWARKEAAAWSFPKGALEAGETPLQAALREFQEETGIAPPPPPYEDLGVVRLRSGKTVQLFLAEGDVDLAAFDPGTFSMTLHGRTFEVPELDAAGGPHAPHRGPGALPRPHPRRLPLRLTRYAPNISRRAVLLATRGTHAYRASPQLPRDEIVSGLHAPSGRRGGVRPNAGRHLHC